MKVLIHKLSNPYYYLCTIIGITFISGAVLSSTNTYSESANATVTVGSACTLTATVNPAHSAEIPAGSSRTDIGLTTLNTICNDAGGFAIYAVGYSNNEYGNNKMLSGSSYYFNTGTATSGANSAWSMKLQQVTTGTYATTIDNNFGSPHNIPTTFTRVAHRDSATDAVGTNPTVGSSISLTYDAYISNTQNAGTYEGKVKFTLVHPASEVPLQPQTTEAGCIRYYPNGKNVEGTMGCQPITASDTSAVLLASNFSREGYGFAGWSTTYDYSDSSGFLGPQEDITFTTGQYTGNNPGLSLYAIWVKSAGTMQTNATSVCNNLSPASYNDEGDSDESTWSIAANLSNVSALTDQRDGQTYAIAKLSDNNCWMIENLRLDNTTSDNSSGILSQGYDNSFVGLANPESPWAGNDISANSLYSKDGSTAITVSNSNCFPRYNNNNTSSSSSDPTSGNSALYLYGNHYTWPAAIADTTQYNDGEHGTTSICPTGWHLPKGTGSGDYGILVNTLGGYQENGVAQQMTYSTTPNNTIASKRLRHFPNNFVLNGNVSAGNYDGRGSEGYYWTSTAISSNAAYGLIIDQLRNYVHPGTGGYSKGMGRAIRCLKDNTN